MNNLGRSEEDTCDFVRGIECPVSVENVTVTVTETVVVAAVETQSALVASGTMETLALTGGATRRNRTVMFAQGTILQGKNCITFILFEMTKKDESTAAS